MPLVGIEPRRLGIEHDLAHRGSHSGAAPRGGGRSRISAAASAS
jgi:hypothetical protein